MSILQSLVLGIVQGLTEFLPISSSGHLILIPHLFGWGAHSIAFDTTLHLGTVAALLVYFWEDLWGIVLSFQKDFFGKRLSFKKYSETSWLGLKILIGCIPAGILGILFSDVFEGVFRGVNYVVVFLILGSLLMLLAELLKVEKGDLSLGKSFVVGIFQSLALFPGVSRSGATISGGMLMGMSREAAAKFSFLLSIPIVVIAGVFELVSSSQIFHTISVVDFLVGFFASFVSGMFAINFMLGFLKTHKLYIFIVYRLVLVLFLLIIF
jgi:undecaprenyl-diphosphatase